MASFAGSNTRLPSSASLLETIAVSPTANSLTSSPNPSYQGKAVTITAAVTSTPGVPLSGSVVFFDGATTLATVPLASGHATFTTSALSAGTHALTASYSGTASLLASTSASVLQVVNPSDFSLATDPPALSLRTGHHTTFTLTASSVGIFADQLQLSSASLPLHVTLVPKPMAPLAAGGQSSVSVYLDTDDVIGYLSSSSASRSTFREILAGATLPALACLAFMPRRRLRLSSRILLLLTALFLSSTVACSGKYPASTAPGSYALQITATGSATGRTHTLNIPLTITE